MFLQQLVNGLTLGSLYAVLAIGLTLVFGVLNIINMAHGGIFMIGAFVGLFMVTVFDVNIFVALIVAMAVGAVLGYLLEFVALRPLRKKKVSHLAPLISTIGVSIFLESLALLLWGPQTRSFPPDYIGGLIDFGVFKISMVQIIGLGVSVLLMVILNVVIKKTKIGKAIRAVSMSTETAALLGINPTMIISVTVMIASALGAAAGVLVGLSFNAIEPTMGVIFVALIVAMAVGAVLGYLLEFVALRPLRKKKVSHLAPLISTIGVSIFLESLALLLWGPQTRSFPPDYIGGLIDFGVFKISMVQIIGLGVSVLLMVILNVVIKKTKIGKAIRAVSMSTETAALLGINPTMIISVTVMIASALGAAAGVLVGLSFNAIEPTMGVIIGFKGLAVLILGGLGNITGAMVGGFILGIAEIFSVAYGASTFRDAVAFGLIIVLLFWRPQGLFGSKDKGGRP